MSNPFKHGYTASTSTRACGCIGPQNGEPRCPCMMQNVKQVDGRWVETIDHGPISSADVQRIFNEYQKQRLEWLSA